MMTLTIIFDKSADHVLMCFHNKQHMWNFVGGHVEPGENPLDASYRELEEETGISSSDVDLVFCRCEQVTSKYSKPWTLYITTGMLGDDVKLKPEENELKWINITDKETICDKSFGFGNCLMFMREALNVLGLVDELKCTYM